MRGHYFLLLRPMILALSSIDTEASEGTEKTKEIKTVEGIGETDFCGFGASAETR